MGNVRAAQRGRASQGALWRIAMKMHTWMAGWLVLALAAGVSVGADKPAGDKSKDTPKTETPAKDGKSAEGTEAKSESTLKGYYAIMASQLKLTDEQKAKLEEAVKACKTAVEANKGKDEKEVEKAREKLRADLAAILTPEQKVQQTFFHKYSRYSLTDDQKDKLRSLCAEASKQAGGKELSEDAAKSLDAAIAGLLTAEQKAKMEKAHEGKKADKSAQTRPADGKSKEK